MFGLVLILTILLLTALEPYAERYLKEQVATNTDGLYSIEFEDININLLATTVTLNNLHLSADTAVHRRQREAGEASPMLIELKTQEFKVAGINLLDAILRKQLSIGRVFMDSPDITVVVDESVETSENKPDEQGNGNAIRNFIESVDIGEIDIPDATIRQLVWGEPNQPVHDIPHLSLGITELELALDQLDQPDHTRIFDADDIRIELKEYVFNTPDSVYTIGFRLFSYSSKEGGLLLEDFVVKADHEANIALATADANRMLFGVRAPRLHMEGFDIVEAYRSKQLQVEHITLENAELEVLENPDIPAVAAEFNLKQLYEQASEYIETVGLEEFRIADARLVYRTKFHEILTVQHLDKLNLSLQEIQIDSATLFTPRDSLPLQEYLITVEDYRYRHPETPYTIDLGWLELSSRDQHLHLDSISVKGDWDKNDSLKQINKAQFIVYNLEAPSLRIDDMDLLQAFQTRMMDIGSILLRSPSLDILHAEAVPEPKLDLEALMQNTYEQLSDFITELNVDQITVQDLYHTQHVKDGDIMLSQELEEASVTLTGLHIDSVFIYQQNPRLPLNDILLTARNYSYRIPDNAQTFALGRLRYSTREKELTARSIELSADTQHNDRLKQSNDASKNLFDFSASLFRITNLDIIRAMNAGRMDIDEITLRQPELAITMDRDVEESSPQNGEQEPATDVLFSFFSPVTVNAIRLENGTFTYREKRDEIIRTQLLEHVSTTVSGLHLSPEKMDGLDEELPLEEMVLTAGNYSYQSPDSLYTITLDSLHYSSREETLTARLFEVDSDREMHEQIKAENFEEASRNLFDITAESFRITGFDLVRSYETGRFNMTEMVLTQPEIAILQDKNVVDRRDGEEPEEETNTAGDRDESEEDQEENTSEGIQADSSQAAGENGALEQVNEIVETFRVERIRVEDGYFSLKILDDTVQRSQTLEHVSVILDELRLASMEAADPLEMFRVDDIGILVKDYSFLTPDSLYEFRLGELRTALNDQLLTIDSIRLEPLFKHDEYQDRLEYAADRIDLKIPGIEMQGFRLDELFNNQEILASKILVKDPDIDIYRDNRVQQDPGRQPYTLQRMLRDLEFRVEIDTVSVIKGVIVYSEIAPDGVEPGVLTLDQTRLLITNITNDSLLFRENNIITVDGSTSLMGESTLEVKFQFQMDHPDDLYTYEGSLEPMKFTAFNPLFEKIMFIRMESGRINKAAFAVTATEHMAEGEMRFLYQNLDMQLIDKEDPENPGFLMNAGSWLINNVVIKDNNPSSFGNLRRGEIEVERDYSKSVFNHMSGAMTSGMASSLMPGWVEWVVDALIGLP
ncbi:hypothetical protein D770_23350 [Flammeovirgaceae bacterium 311]|nr:hypothetical protein D770_23350 [Flammeovirgaceae bacterium 311]